jgi:uncharacterized membrane protein
MDPVTWIIALATFIAYDTISVFKYLRLDPGSWDLGIFTEYVKQIAYFRAPVVSIRGAGFNLLGDHFQPIVGLLAPVFRVFPTPETLLVAQALLTAASVIPVCRAAQELLGTWASRGIGLAYGFSWGLQQMISFDFHEIAFAVPLLAFSLSALVRRRLRPAILWALPLVFVKEDQGFTVAAIGLVMAGMGLAVLARGDDPPGPRWLKASARPGGRPPGTPRRLLRHGALALSAGARHGAAEEPAAWIRGGVLLAAWGLAWSVLAIAVIIPHFNPMHHYPYWYDGGVVGPGGHPSVSGLAHQVIQSGHEKLWTTYLILLPVAFLALRSPLVLIALPSLALRFISTNSYFWGTGWHYDATVMPIVFLAAVDGMARFRASSQRRALPAGAASRPGTPPVPARGGDPPEPPDGLRPGSSVTGPGPVAAQRRGATRLPAPGEAVARYGAAVMVVIAGWLALRFPLDTLWSSQTYDISSHVSAEDAAMARVPNGVTVEATLSMLAPLAARDDTYWIGITPNPAPDYVVFDETNSGWSPPPANVLTFIEQRHPGWAYLRVFTDDGVDVFRRVGRTGG